MGLLSAAAEQAAETVQDISGSTARICDSPECGVRLFEIRRSRFQESLGCLAVGDDCGERLFHFMADGSDNCLRVCELVVPLALEKHIRVGKALFALTPFGKQRSKHERAQRNDQNNSLRLQDPVRDWKPGIAEVANAENGGPDDSKANHERANRGED